MRTKCKWSFWMPSSARSTDPNPKPWVLKEILMWIVKNDPLKTQYTELGRMPEKGGFGGYSLPFFFFLPDIMQNAVCRDRRYLCMWWSQRERIHHVTTVNSALLFKTYSCISTWKRFTVYVLLSIYTQQWITFIAVYVFWMDIWMRVCTRGSPALTLVMLYEG